MRAPTLFAMIGAVALGAMGLLLMQPSKPRVIVIGLTNTRQTIEGIGATATGTWIPAVRELYAKPEFARAIGDDLGVSIIRLALPPATQINVDLDVGTLDLAKFDMAAFEPPAGFIREMRASHPELKVMLTVWSPPAWMKDNHATIKGGRLREDRREHFAKFCAAACLGFERTYGVPVYALSIQNEPVFVQTYDSCIYTPAEMVATAKAVRAAFLKWGVKAKLMAPEDMADGSRLPGYLSAFAEDSAARDGLDIVNVHGEPREASGGITGPWMSLRDRANALGKPLWMTETSGEDPSWLGSKEHPRGGLALAASIHHALVDGECAAWVYWAITDPQADEFALMALDAPTPKYAALKQFAKFIRPGAVRLQIPSPNPKILVSAYLKEEQKTLTVVLINLGASDSEVSIQLSALPVATLVEFEGVRSSSTEQCVATPKSIYDGRGPFKLVLPRQSVTTLSGVIKPAPARR